MTPHQSVTVKESISILKLSFVELRPISHSSSMYRCLIAYLCNMFASVVIFCCAHQNKYKAAEQI